MVVWTDPLSLALAYCVTYLDLQTWELLISDFKTSKLTPKAYNTQGKGINKKPRCINFHFIFLFVFPWNLESSLVPSISGLWGMSCLGSAPGLLACLSSLRQPACLFQDVPARQMRKEINLSVLQLVGGLSLIRAAEMMAHDEQTVSFSWSLFQNQNIHSFPKDLVCYWRCIWNQKAPLGYGCSSLYHIVYHIVQWLDQMILEMFSNLYDRWNSRAWTDSTSWFSRWVWWELRPSLVCIVMKILRKTQSFTGWGQVSSCCLSPGYIPLLELLPHFSPTSDTVGRCLDALSPFPQGLGCHLSLIPALPVCTHLKCVGLPKVTLSYTGCFCSCFVGLLVPLFLCTVSVTDTGNPAQGV